MNWLLTTWDLLRTSLWLIPSIMIAAGVALAITMLQVDAGYGHEDQVRAWWMNDGTGEDARNLLSTLLAATITMASMAFSVTVVALTLAANAYGSRLIRVFRADVRTQVVLGTFAMTIVYCLLVLRSVFGDAPPPRVPHASVTVGTALALACVFALLSFIQGVARSITADEVIRRVESELDKAVREFPYQDGEDLEDARPPDFDSAERIPLPREGYVQAVDYEGIVQWADKRNAMVRLDFRPGDYVVDGDLRLLIYPPTGDAQRVRKELGRWIISGQERTPTQDVEFAIRHLVEIAVRALSPGINDPFTAMAVIDRLRGGLSRLMKRQLPLTVLRGQEGIARIWRQTTTYEGAFDAALHQIRQAAGSHPAVLIHLLEALGGIAEHAQIELQRLAILKHARLIKAAADRNIPESQDAEDVAKSFERVLLAIEKHLGKPPEEDLQDADRSITSSTPQ